MAIPLIKAFQSEFDGLLARSTAAENALIDICKSIVSLPGLYFNFPEICVLAALKTTIFLKRKSI